MSNYYIEKVSFDGVHFLGGIPVAELPKLKQEYRDSALRILQEGTADSVAYCHLQYNEEGNCTVADFYRGLEMDEATLRQRIADIPGTDYIGAVHRMK